MFRCGIVLWLLTFYDELNRKNEVGEEGCGTMESGTEMGKGGDCREEGGGS